MNAKEMCERLMTYPDMGIGDMSMSHVADMIETQAEIILARVADVQRLTKERDDAREQLAGHNERENSIINGARKHRDALENELAAALSEVKRLQSATVKQPLTVPDAEFEVVRPEPDGVVMLDGRDWRFGALWQHADFSHWLWDCGPHGEREASCQLWWDRQTMYTVAPRDPVLPLQVATRVGAVMRRMK